jgi:hypothetical protein
MATLDIEEPKLPNEPVVVLYSRKVLAAAGTDERLSWRALVGVAVTAGCVVLAPTPFNIIGAVSCALVAIEVARLAWRK